LQCRACPNCFCWIEKNGGCNHMTCKRCTCGFCYKCGLSRAMHTTSNFPCS
jgi:hypothetical protein